MVRQLKELIHSFLITVTRFIFREILKRCRIHGSKLKFGTYKVFGRWTATGPHCVECQTVRDTFAKAVDKRARKQEKRK